MRWKDDSTVVNPKGWTERYRKPDDLHAWSLVQEGGASARIFLEKLNPVSASNSQSLRLDVINPGSGRTGVANSGYWGIPARKGARYELSFYARKNERFTGTLTASLDSPDDENSFEQRDRVVPRSSRLSGLGESFEYSCPSNSVSILRMMRKR